MSQNSRYEDHHQNQQQQSYTNSGAPLPVPADINGPPAPFLPEMSFSEIWDIQEDPQSNALLVNYGHPNSAINFQCSSGDVLCESNDGGGGQQSTGTFFLQGNESSSVVSPSFSSTLQFVDTSKLPCDTPWHSYTTANTTHFANQTYCTASPNSASCNTVSPSVISPPQFGECSNLTDGSHWHSHLLASNSDYPNQMYYSTSNNSSTESQPFVDTNSLSSLPSYPLSYSLETDIAQMTVGYLGGATENNNSVGQSWESLALEEVFDDLHLVPPQVTAKPPEKQQRQPGQHRSRRLRLPEGAERDQHRRRLANVRSRDHNAKKKKENLRLEEMEEELKKENIQLKEKVRTYEAMKTYFQAVHDQYVKPFENINKSLGQLDPDNFVSDHPEKS